MEESIALAKLEVLKEKGVVLKGEGVEDVEAVLGGRVGISKLKR